MQHLQVGAVAADCGIVPLTITRLESDGTGRDAVYINMDKT